MTAKAFKDHQIRETVSQIKSMQSMPEFASPEMAADENMAFARDKIFAIARSLGALIEQTPATLVNMSALSQLHLNLHAPLQELTHFVANKNVAHIRNAASQMEQNVLPLFTAFGSKYVVPSKAEALQLVEALQSTASQSIAQLSAERNKLKTELDDLRSSIQAQEGRLETLSETVARERAEAVSTVSNLERQFSEKEIERNEDFQKLLSNLSLQTDAVREESKKEAEKALQALEKYRDDAARIVQVVGNIGITGNYQQIAKSEQDQANFWRWATIAFFACGVLIAGATFIKFYNTAIDSSNIWTIAIRLLYAIAITAPALYTARESARHRSNSDRAKQTELELASIGPFVELMPELKQIEIREKLVSSFFGNGIEPHTIKSAMDATQLKDLLYGLAQFIKK